jgi:hypothetical protein
LDILKGMLRCLSLALGLLLTSTVSADSYLQGYAQGVVAALAPGKAIQVTGVDRGRAFLTSNECVDDAQRAALKQVLMDNPAITAVAWRTKACQAAQTLKDRPTGSTTGDIKWLPKGELFPPLLADPREPHYAVQYQAHAVPIGDINTAQAAIGDYFPIVRGDSRVGQVEFGIQAGTFSLFNLDSDSSDLINTDFIVGLPVSYRLGSFSARAQVYHQSSHLGDELVLGNPDIDRVNLSFEDSELLLAYELSGFRLYGGGGYLLRSEPDLDPVHGQLGVEFRWPELIGGFDLVAAGDFQTFEKQDWEVNRSYQAGLAWRGEIGREVRLMLERYDGSSPHGQFFNTPLEFWGLGLFFSP